MLQCLAEVHQKSLLTVAPACLRPFAGKLGATSSSLDYSANFNRMMGYTNSGFDELMRLYLTIHSVSPPARVRPISCGSSFTYLWASSRLC